MRRPYFLGVAGNIGVGKTHVTRYLGERLGWEVFYEPVADNPYLDDFYTDMRRWSFQLQVFFLSRRFEIHRKMMNNLLSCVQDRTIYEDAAIFAHTLHETGAMDARDYQNYKELFSCMTSYLRPPDVILYLRASIETLLGRIERRGRDCERQLDRSYLRLLNQAYEEWVARSAPDLRFVIVETDGFENIEKHPVIANLLTEIEQGAKRGGGSPRRRAPKPGTGS